MTWSISAPPAACSGQSSVKQAANTGHRKTDAHKFRYPSPDSRAVHSLARNSLAPKTCLLIPLPAIRLPRRTPVAGRKRGQVQFVGTVRRVLRTKGTCPLSRILALETHPIHHGSCPSSGLDTKTPVLFPFPSPRVRRPSWPAGKERRELPERRITLGS
jgi:hypothetical protein